MWKIIDNLYLGDSSDAEDLPRLLGEGVTHVVNCAGGGAARYPSDFEYLQLNVCSDQFRQQIDQICPFVDRGRAAGVVLVHCQEAQQRGPASVIAYLCHIGYSVEKAIGAVQAATAARAWRFRQPPRGLMQPIRDRYERGSADES